MSSSPVSRRPRLSLLALAVVASGVLASSPTVDAQVTEKQAVAALKKEVKSRSKTFATDLKAATKTFDTELKGFEAVVKSGGYGQVAFVDLVDDLETLQAAVATALTSAASGLAGANSTSLLNLQNAIGSLGGHFPDGFYNADGEAAEDFFADLRNALDKAYAKLRKRLAKTARLLEKQASVAFLFKIRPPGGAQQRITSGAGSVTSFTVPHLTFDLLVSASMLGVDDDALVCVGGEATAFPGNVDLTIPFSAFADMSIGPSSNRWRQIYTGGSEGNYLFQISQGGDTITERFGVR